MPDLLNEDVARVDYILKLGFGKDPKKLNYYRRVLRDRRWVEVPALRPFGSELLENFLHILFTDPVVWARVKTILLRKHELGKNVREDLEVRVDKSPRELLAEVKRVLKENSL